MRGVDFVVPGALDTPTGGYRYDRRIIEGLRALGWRVSVRTLEADFPAPAQRSLDHFAAVLEALPAGRCVVVDGLAFGGAARVLERAAAHLELVALVHHPLALETGLDAHTRAALERDERAALAACRRVIVTSAWTARALEHTGVAAERIDVCKPGTDSAAPGRGGGDPVRLLSVAALTPRKGHATLVAALAGLGDRRWTLDCAGSATRDPATAAALERASACAALGERIAWHGDVDAATLERLYTSADVFVLASELEGYGMALTEALAHGLPIVSTTAGAIPETVPADAALLVEPGDTDALAAALARVIDDARLRERLRAGALAARAHLPGWDTASRMFAAALERVVNR